MLLFFVEALVALGIWDLCRHNLLRLLRTKFMTGRLIKEQWSTISCPSTWYTMQWNLEMKAESKQMLPWNINFHNSNLGYIPSHRIGYIDGTAKFGIWYRTRYKSKTIFRNFCCIWTSWQDIFGFFRGAARTHDETTPFLVTWVQLSVLTNLVSPSPSSIEQVFASIQTKKQTKCINNWPIAHLLAPQPLKTNWLIGLPTSRPPSFIWALPLVNPLLVNQSNCRRALNACRGIPWPVDNFISNRRQPVWRQKCWNLSFKLPNTNQPSN